MTTRIKTEKLLKSQSYCLFIVRNRNEAGPDLADRALRALGAAAGLAEYRLHVSASGLDWMRSNQGLWRRRGMARMIEFVQTNIGRNLGPEETGPLTAAFNAAVPAF